MPVSIRRAAIPAAAAAVASKRAKGPRQTRPSGRDRPNRPIILPVMASEKDTHAAAVAAAVSKYELVGSTSESSEGRDVSTHP